MDKIEPPPPSIPRTTPTKIEKQYPSISSTLKYYCLGNPTQTHREIVFSITNKTFSFGLRGKMPNDKPVIRYPLNTFT
jgi:hypothetical protein